MRIKTFLIILVFVSNILQSKKGQKRKENDSFGKDLRKMGIGKGLQTILKSNKINDDIRKTQVKNKPKLLAKQNQKIEQDDQQIEQLEQLEDIDQDTQASDNDNDDNQTNVQNDDQNKKNAKSKKTKKGQKKSKKRKNSPENEKDKVQGEQQNDEVKDQPNTAEEKKDAQDDNKKDDESVVDNNQNQQTEEDKDSDKKTDNQDEKKDQKSKKGKTKDKKKSKKENKCKNEENFEKCMQDQMKKKLKKLLKSLEILKTSLKIICKNNQDYCKQIFSKLNTYKEFEPYSESQTLKEAKKIAIDNANQIAQIAIKELEIQDKSYQKKLKRISRKAALQACIDMVEQSPKDMQKDELLASVNEETERQAQLAIKKYFEDQQKEKTQNLAKKGSVKILASLFN